MRFVAEAAWYPTALLPSQGARWQAVDADSARATLDDGENRVSLLFRFNAQELIDTVHADARGRSVAVQVVPRRGRAASGTTGHGGGMLIPRDGEVAWLLPNAPKPYWRGHLTDIGYDNVR